MEPNTGPLGGPVRRGAPSRRAGSRLWVGLALIAVGVVAALATYGLVDVDPWRRLWPLILVFFGARHLVRSGGRGAGGFILLFLGLGFLLDNFGLLPLDGRLVPAAILTVVGVSLALSALMPRRRPPLAGAAPAPAGAGSLVHPVAVLSAVAQATTAEDFRGGSAVAFLGSCEIDLRGAAIGIGGGGGEAVIDVTACWAGVRIYVPERWQVEIEGSAFLGAFESAALSAAGSSERLVVTGLAVMGAVEVRNHPEAD